jgi:nitrate reductase alpha subunit
VGRRGLPPRPGDGQADPKYFQRGKDKWLRVTWDEAYDLLGQGAGEHRAHLLRRGRPEAPAAQGYDPAMVEATEGAGTQTIKLRGGMAFLGATRIFGLYRFANMMALADAKIRGVGPDKAIGARGWDSYSWHTDLPPGHPMVTGRSRPTTSICSPSSTPSSRWSGA